MVQENSTFVRKFQHGNTKRRLRKKKQPPVRNPSGNNQYSNKKFKTKFDSHEIKPTPVEEIFSPKHQIHFAIGSAELESKRLSKKLRFIRSPSKLSTKRSSELFKVSKLLAIKALGCVMSKPEKVFDLLCEKEVDDRLNEGKLFKQTPELTCFKMAFNKARSSLEKKRVLYFCAPT